MKVTTLKQAREQMQKLLDTQGMKGNWDYDPYMQGMYNGMELAMCVLENREPVYKTTPKKWLAEYMNKKVTIGDLLRDKWRDIKDDVVYHTVKRWRNQ